MSVMVGENRVEGMKGNKLHGMQLEWSKWTNYNTLASSWPFAPFLRTRNCAGLSACTPVVGNCATSNLCASPCAGEMNSLYGESGMCWSLNLMPTRYSPGTQTRIKHRVRIELMQLVCTEFRQSQNIPC